MAWGNTCGGWHRRATKQPVAKSARKARKAPRDKQAYLYSRRNTGRLEGRHVSGCSAFWWNPRTTGVTNVLEPFGLACSVRYDGYPGGQEDNSQKNCPARCRATSAATAYLVCRRLIPCSTRSMTSKPMSSRRRGPQTSIRQQLSTAPKPAATPPSSL